MHVEINSQFECAVDSDKTIPLAALGEFLTEQDIPASIRSSLIQSRSRTIQQTIFWEGAIQSTSSLPSTADPAAVQWLLAIRQSKQRMHLHRRCNYQ